MSKNASLKIDRYGVGSLVVDGVDLSMSVAPEFTITGRSGQPAVVAVRLVGLNFAVDLDGADVEIPESVAKALEAMGWKRPGPTKVSTSDVKDAAVAYRDEIDRAGR